MAEFEVSRGGFVWPKCEVLIHSHTALTRDWDDSSCCSAARRKLRAIRRGRADRAFAHSARHAAHTVPASPTPAPEKRDERCQVVGAQGFHRPSGRGHRARFGTVLQAAEEHPFTRFEVSSEFALHGPNGCGRDFGARAGTPGLHGTDVVGARDSGTAGQMAASPCCR
jgi:hypothetical protein